MTLHIAIIIGIFREIETIGDMSETFPISLIVLRKLKASITAILHMIARRFHVHQSRSGGM